MAVPNTVSDNAHVISPLDGMRRLIDGLSAIKYPPDLFDFEHLEEEYDGFGNESLQSTNELYEGQGFMSTQTTPTKSLKRQANLLDQRRWGSSDDRRIAQTVHNLVSEKYQGSLNKYLGKFGKRKARGGHNINNAPAMQPLCFDEIEENCFNNSPTNEVAPKSESLPDSSESGHSDYDERTFLLNAIGEEMQKSASSSSDYDEQRFLQNAIGEELRQSESSSVEYFCPKTTASINTDDISALISSRSSFPVFKKRKNRKSLNTFVTNSSSYYENVSKEGPLDSSKELLLNEPLRYSYPSYEEVTSCLGDDEVDSSQSRKQIKKHVLINETIVNQTKKMLKYGLKKSRGFIGSYGHLEGERILLVSQMRKQLLINHLYKIPESTNQEAAVAQARLTISNLKCILNKPCCESSYSRTSASQQHYVCVLQHQRAVYSSRMALPNKLGCVDFGGFFIFDGVTNTFSVKIQLYSLDIPKGALKCFSCCKPGPKLPMIDLVGEAHIDILNMKNNKTFTLKSTEGLKGEQPHQLTASVEASLNWPEGLKMFVNVGTAKLGRQPTWNHRWCVLLDGTLKYYYHPSDEFYGPPLRAIDLQLLMKDFEESPIRHVTKKTLRVFLKDDSGDVTVLLLSPDRKDEFDLLTKHLTVVLKLIQQWR